MAIVMFKIRVVNIWTMDDLIDLLKSIKKRMLTIENLALIIIDSLPSLMFQFLGDENKIGKDEYIYVYVTACGVLFM